MRKIIFLLGALAAAALLPHPARACGFGEAPGDCGNDMEEGAKYLLKRAATAIKADKAKALQEFTHGEAGFRTADTYVFCVGPDGTMTAHPSPMLQGQNVSDLHDKTGNYFIRTMMANAKPDVVAQIRYLFPRPGGTTALPKTTFYTRIDDQVCGVGVYDGDDQAPAPATPRERVAQLEQRLNGEIPPAARADWEAYLQAVKERDSARNEALTKAREMVDAALGGDKPAQPAQ